MLSGYPHLEEAYRVAELLFPALGRTSPVFTPRDAQPVTHTSTPTLNSERAAVTVGRFQSI